MSDRETSAENQSVETEVASDEAVEETKKRAILGSGSEADDANERADPAVNSNDLAVNHVDDDDVEKGSMENCDDAKEDDEVEEHGGLSGDDSLIFDMKRSPPSQSSPPSSSPPPSKKPSTAVEASSSHQSQPQSQPLPQSQEVDVSKQIYHVKWIGWHDTRCPIIMQNVNGPCPLISITNVLLLRGKMSLDEGVEVVSSESLIAYVGERLLIQMWIIIVDKIYVYSYSRPPFEHGAVLPD